MTMPMRALLPLLLALLPQVASADLYTLEKNGEIFISTRRMPGARVLYHVKDDGKPAPRAAQRRAAPRRQGPVEPAGRRARAARFTAHVRGAAVYYGLPEALVWAVMRTESDFKPHVVSDKGAEGLMQLMPLTAQDMGVTNSFDPEENIYGGARYLRILANKFDGDLVLTLSAYHAGGGAVSRVDGIPYEQTAEYVRRVLNAYYRYQKKLPVEP